MFEDAIVPPNVTRVGLRSQLTLQGDRTDDVGKENRDLLPNYLSDELQPAYRNMYRMLLD